MDHLLAAVDLGSNSFRLSIGRVVQQNGVAQIYATDRLRESARLAAGLDDDNRISDEAIERALVILKRFGERLAGFRHDQVRAVATNTFRIATNAADILPLAEQALGFPIEIISGREEARLIFSGVANELPPSDDKRLVIDIGGGSTEVIIGSGFKPIRLSSLFMGCVSHTRQFFPDGKITELRMRQAILAARREFEGISRQYRKTGWDTAYGSSGTAKGLIAILGENQWSPKGIRLEGMEKLKDKLIRDGKVIMSELPGIKADRAPVLAGGLAIMLAGFQELGIDQMLAGEGALRVGVLYDLLGRDSKHDKREETVRQFIKRYQVDPHQGTRVRKQAQAFMEQLELPDDGEKRDLELALGWASELHEIGISVAHADYHKHGAYILEHADMPGFSRDDQQLLALLCLGHQGKLAKLRPLSPSRNRWMTLLCLRLAVQLLRRRQNSGVPVKLKPRNGEIRISVPRAWLDTHPLSEYSLQNEIKEWGKAGFALTLHET